MTVMELGITGITGIAVGTPAIVTGVKNGSKPLVAIGAAIIAAPITYAGVLIASAKIGEIREKASKKKNTSSDEA